ncbi:MAG: T9SS type A sorting domain-containing protein [candidate division WOR-3 bacterium]
MRRLAVGIVLFFLTVPVVGQITWNLATPAAPWAPRELHASVAFDNSMWVLYGRGADAKDVWSSKDGTNWTQAASTPGYGNDQVALDYDGKMWLLGGYKDGNYTSDVLYSTDGETWIKVNTNQPMWTSRIGHRALVYDGKMWVLGGFQYPGYDPLNDVWYSTDGATWTLATPAAQWPPRFWHSAAVHDGKMWVLGGCNPDDLNDVWYSTNGLNWTQATSAAGWSARHLHTSVGFDGKLWVLGGYDGSHRNDVWYSTDGAYWTEMPRSTPMWSQRCSHTTIVYDSKIWVMGGQIAHNNFLNDVWWTSGSGGVEEEAESLLLPWLEVSPNPVTGEVTTVKVQGFKGSRVQGANLRVFDAAGRCVLVHLLAIGEWSSGIPLDIRRLSSGIYLARLEASEFSVAQRIVVSRLR